MRKLVTIRIDPEVLRKARKLGLNISKTCENVLVEAIKQFENVNLKRENKKKL